MTVELMRAEINKVYPNKVWKTKVKYMPASQVMAIYYNFLANGKFDKKSNIEKDQPTQLSFW